MKKVLAAVLAALMVFGMLPTGLMAYDYAEPKVYLNGELTGAATYYSMVQYVPIARALGYEITYDAQTHSVTSVKGDTIIFFVLHSDEVKVTRAGVEENFSGNGIWVDEIDGSTYINETVLRQVFGLKFCYIDEGYDIYDEAAAIERFKSRIPNFYAFVQAQALPENYSLKADYSGGFQLDSNTFGIHLNGAAAGKVAFDKQGEVMTLDTSTSTDGLMNFSTLVSILGQQQALGEEQFKALGISLDDPISGRVYYNGEELFVQSESMVPAGMMQYLPWNAPEEAKRSVAQNARDKWVKVWMEGYAQRQVTQFLEQLEKMQDADRQLEETAESILSTPHYSYYDKTEGSWYALNLQTLDSLADVISRSYVVEQREEGTICRVHMDSEDYRALTANQTGVFSTLFGSMDSGISDETDFELVATTVCRPDGSQTTEIALNLQIHNFPNGLGLQCGTVNVEAGLTGELTPGGKPFPKPGEYVDFEQVFYDTLNSANAGQ